MAAVLTIVDETAAGTSLGEMQVAFEQPRVTVKDIIASRVEAEVAKYNEKLPDYFSGLVQPTDAEQTLNGYKIQGKRSVDAEKQVYVALAAFQKNGYFVLIDDVQAETLDQEVDITGETRVSFVKLTPLVGG